MQLLAKTAEDRYQSTQGLIYDLTRCLDQLRWTQSIESFPLGLHDATDTLLISQKLYGRETQVKMLLAGFDRVSTGSKELILVTGYSGIGKTVLVDEIHKPAVAKRAYFISGKFEQYTCNIPYSAIVMAFRSLIQQVLAEPDKQLHYLKKKLSAALEPNGRVIADIIPELLHLIGVQPEVSPLGPNESQNRFKLVFQKFIQVFTQKAHPLILFLDDLQWVDAPSLSLLQQMMTWPESGYLLIIGAFRDNEVQAGHPLLKTIDDIKRYPAPVSQLTLEPLDKQDLNLWLADTLNAEISGVEALGQLLFEKTDGSPFFVKQFLKTIHQEKLLRFDAEQMMWSWDMDKIIAQNITDNVAVLMAGKLRHLPDETRDVLKFAAALGNRFSLRSLCLVLEKPYMRVTADLWEALLENMIIPVDDQYDYMGLAETTHIEALGRQSEYQFAHDRIQQAAYSLIDEHDKPGIHLKIGRLMAANLSEAEMNENMFDVVSHLNSGKILISDPSERDYLIELNLMAGRKAKASVAYETGLRYFRTGTGLLNRNSWQDKYRLSFNLYKELAETEYLNGNFEESDEAIDIILSHAESDLEKAAICSIRVTQYTMSANYEKAVRAGKEALQLLGISLPEHDLQNAIQNEIEETKKNLENRSIYDLLLTPLARDEEKQIAMNLLCSLAPPLFISGRSEMYVIVMIKSVNLSLKYGTMRETAFAYASFGVILGPVLGDYELSSQYAELALELSDKIGDKVQRCKVCQIVGGLSYPWVKNLPLLREILVDGYQSGLDSGEFQYAGFCLGNNVQNLFSQGENLEKHNQEVFNCLSFFKSIKNQLAFDMITFHQFINLNLLGLTMDKFAFHSDAYSEDELLNICEQGNDSLSLFSFYVYKSLVLYLYDTYEEALHAAEKALEFKGGATGLICNADHLFYHSLALAAICNEKELSENKKATYLDQLRSNQNQMKIWSDNCPENFLHKYVLVEAEIAWFEGDHSEAIVFYDQAIVSAKENGFIHNQAMANERSAKFWLKKGQEKIAGIYVREAHYCYKLWGAKRKVADLEKTYPRFFSRFATDPLYAACETGELDVITVIKASQAISGEIKFNSLLRRIMTIMIESAGAQKAALILEQDGELRVIATLEGDQEKNLDFKPVALESAKTVSSAIVNYVKRTGQVLVIDDASLEERFKTDQYIMETHPKSVLCSPIMKQAQFVGVIYLENNLIFNAFTSDRLAVVNLLAAQAGISIENALFFEQKQKYAEELSIERSLFKTIVDRLPIMITRYDPNANFLFLNREFEIKIGWNTKEVQNIDLMEKVYPDPEYRKQVFRYMQMSGNEWQEFQVTTKSGQIIESEWSNVRLDDGTQIGIGIDVTDKKRLEESLRQSQKMEAIGTLAGGIAHDFNNMLGIITGNISYALSSLKKEDELYEVLTDVQESTQQAKGLTDQLLTFSKGGAPIKKIADINKIISDAAIFSMRGAKSRCNFELSNDLWPSEVDEGQINQVVNNLVINANQAMPNGGNIAIRTENASVEIESVIPLPEGKYIKISIEDQGVGISKKHLSNIFEPYFTTKQSGSGLGLATTYSIIKRHEGHITVYSELEKGTVFNIYLLASLKDFKEPEDQKKTNQKGQGKILIMDDQEPILKMVGRMLNKMGYDVSFATDGTQAIESYRKAYEVGRPFDLVILDLTVPGGMGGAKTIPELLKIDPNVKAVVSSGYSNDPIMANYEDYGFCGVAPKPYTKDQLGEILDTILGKNA